MTIPTELIGETAAEVPCPPLGAAELSAAEAERMGCMVKALAGPVRLRLLPRDGHPPPQEAEGGGRDHLRTPRYLGVLPGRARRAARDAADAVAQGGGRLSIR